MINFRTEGEIATVTLDRPEKRNALTLDMLDLLEQCVRTIAASSAIRVVILTGAGSEAFCAGGDVNEWSVLNPLDMWRTWNRRGHQVFDQWAQLRQPVIAAINGAALGGGLELAATSDLRIASENAKFALPEAAIAMCPGWSGTQRLVRLMGISQVKLMGLAGVYLDATSALQKGLIHEVIPPADLLERAGILAQNIARRAPVAVQLCKQLINAASGEASPMALETIAGALAATTEDASEGQSSFKEKREALYTGT